MARIRGLSRFAAFLRDLRVVWWFVAALLALFAADRASASEYATYATAADAKAACDAKVASYGTPITADGQYLYLCVYAAGTYNATYNKGSYTIRAKFNNVAKFDRFWFANYGCVAPTTWDAAAGACTNPNAAADAACAAKGEWFTNVQFPSGSVHCDPVTDCAMVAANLGDGGEVSLAPYLQSAGVGLSCVTGQFTCPAGFIPAPEGYPTLVQLCFPMEGDIDGDGIPNDEDPTPDEAGDVSHDSDGDGVPDARDPFPLDPDNGQDLEAGETTPTASGGGNCSTPPTVNGDAVGAQVAYQTWATRCAVDRLNATTKGGVNVTVTGGSVGTGNSTQAEIEGMSDGEGMAASGDAAGLTQALEFGADGLDDTRFGAQVGGTCPVIPPINLGALGTLEIDTTTFCEWMELTSILVLILASLGSLRILGGPA